LLKLAGKGNGHDHPAKEHMKPLTTASPSKNIPNFITWRTELLICLMLSTAFGIFEVSASNKILNRQDHRAESVEMERSILRGKAFPHGGRQLYVAPWQNRIIFPALLELCIRIGGMGANAWYVALRLAFCMAMFMTFWFILRAGAEADLRLAVVGLLLLAYCLFMSFSTLFEMSSDFSDAMFASIFIFVALRRKRWVLLAVSILAAANRESAAFAGVIWFFLYAIDDERKINWREAGFGVLVSICSYGTALALRYGFGGSEAIGAKTQYLSLRHTYYNVLGFIQHPSPFAWPGLIFCSVLPCGLWIWLNRDYLTGTHKRLLLAACAISFISIFFGNIMEIRTFISPLVISIFVAVSAETRRMKSLPDISHSPEPSAELTGK